MSENRRDRLLPVSKLSAILRFHRDLMSLGNYTIAFTNYDIAPLRIILLRRQNIEITCNIFILLIGINIVSLIHVLPRLHV